MFSLKSAIALSIYKKVSSLQMNGCVRVLAREQKHMEDERREDREQVARANWWQSCLY